MTRSGLEGLPVEIQASVLHAISDLQTLHNLIIASRKYNETYRTYRKTVLPATTLRDFASRRIFATQRIHWTELCVVRHHSSKPDLSAAILKYYWRSRDGKDVQMTYDECLPLLALEDARTWGSGKHPVHRGRSVFLSRRLVSSKPCYNTKNREFIFLTVEGDVPYKLRYGVGGKTYAW